MQPQISELDEFREELKLLPQYMVGREDNLDECQWGDFLEGKYCPNQALFFVCDTHDEEAATCFFHIGHYCQQHIIEALHIYNRWAMNEK